jgi:hypothetical protein
MPESEFAMKKYSKIFKSDVTVPAEYKSRNFIILATVTVPWYLTETG